MDAAHYAAVLAVLDARDRVLAAEAQRDPERAEFYAEWALRSAERAEEYLAGSSADRAPGHESRPEYAPVEVLAATAELRRRALIIRPPQNRLVIQFGQIQFGQIHSVIA